MATTPPSDYEGCDGDGEEPHLTEEVTLASDAAQVLADIEPALSTEEEEAAKAKHKKEVVSQLNSIYSQIISVSKEVILHHKADLLQRQLLGAVSGELTDRYNVDYNHVLGVGSFGVVYRGVDLASGRFVAVKVAKVGALVPAVAKELCSEFNRIKSTKDGGHIVNVLDFYICKRTGTAQLFMEWMAGGSVSSIMASLTPNDAAASASPVPALSTARGDKIVAVRMSALPLATLRRYMKYSLESLDTLSKLGIVHKDIKPSNMLVNEEGTLKVGDLGAASLFGAATITSAEDDSGDCFFPELMGTPAYMAPECVRCGQYSAASDMWSWACSVVEMATGRVPWYHLPEQQQKACATMFHVGGAPERDQDIREILSVEDLSIMDNKGEGDAVDSAATKKCQPHLHFCADYHRLANGVVYPLIPDDLPVPLIELVTWCFRSDPDLRPSAEQLLDSHFVRAALA